MRAARSTSSDPTAVVVISLASLLLGLMLGLVLGVGSRRPMRVRCTQTLRIEAVGPGTWTLVCEGAR